VKTKPKTKQTIRILIRFVLTLQQEEYYNADIRSRANTTRGWDFDHMIKTRTYKEGMRIGKTSKKLDSICCPQRRETKADTLKATEANRRRGPGTREKVSSRRINLEGNTHVQEINACQLLV
jgi:hypothetical protein